MKKEIIDYKNRRINLETIDLIKVSKPDENKPGKFIIKAILHDKNSIVIYQTVGTEDTWYYNNFEISYVLDTLTSYIRLNTETDTELDLTKTIHYCRHNLLKGETK